MRGKLTIIVLIMAGLGALFSGADTSPAQLAQRGTTTPGLVDPDKAARVAPQSAGLSATARGQLHVVTASRLNLRSGPSTSYPVMMVLPQGTNVSVLEQRQGWARLGTQSGSAWASARYLSPVTAAVPGDPLKIAPKPKPKRQVAAPSTAEITRARSDIIRQSIASYPGSCPCPYNIDRGGRRCGGRSAWSRPGGYAPICYDSDISQARLASYFARKRGAVD